MSQSLNEFEFAALEIHLSVTHDGNENKTWSRITHKVNITSLKSTLWVPSFVVFGGALLGHNKGLRGEKEQHFTNDCRYHSGSGSSLPRSRSLAPVT